MPSAHVFSAHESGVATRFCISGAGPLLLLIHGAEATRRMFDGLVPCLADRFSVVTYDQRDCGETTNPADSYDLLDLAKDAARLIDHLSEGPVRVFGTSLGGAVAQGLVHLHPDKVSALVLASTWPVGRRLADFSPVATQALATLRALPGDHSREIAQYYFTSAFIDEHPEQVEAFRPKALTPGRVRRLSMLGRVTGDHQRLDLHRYRGPAMLLAGSDDRLIPPEVTFELARELPQASEVLLDGVPHTGSIDCPGVIAEPVAQFLSTPLDS